MYDVSGRILSNSLTIRYCSANGGITIKVFAISRITQFLFPTPRVFSSACFCTSGELSKCIKYRLNISSWLNFSNATLTKRLNSSSVSTITGIPVVPTLVRRISPYSGSHRQNKSRCSCSEMNLQLEKFNFPLLTSFTEMKGTPEATYLGFA